MGPLYANKVTINESLLLESARCAVRYRSRTYSALMLALSLLSLLVGTYFLMQIRWYFFFGYLLAACFLYFALFSYILPVRRVYRSIRHASEDTGVCFATQFSDTSLDVSIDGISSVIPYDSVTALVESAHLITLVIGNRTFLPSCIPLDKALFSSEKLDFVLFLKRRIPNLHVRLLSTRE